VRISVVIPTWGRVQEPVRTLQDLTRQTRLPDEIIVVDQNQPAVLELDQVLEGIPYARQIRASRPGVCPNYNLGWRESRGEIVLFLDDDVELDPELIASHLRLYDDEEKQPASAGKTKKLPLGGVAGRVEQPAGDLDPHAIVQVGKYFALTGKVIGNFNSVKPCEVQIAPGGNMSFYRSVLEKIGGFDSGFSGNGFFFETDASLRVCEAGYRILFEPRATLKHLMAPRGGARMTDKAEHTYYFVKNGIRLYEKHSPRLGRPWFMARMATYSAAKALWNRDPEILKKGVQAVAQSFMKSL